MIRAYKEVSDRKASTQTGFKKLNYPQFNGDVLNYQEFKRRWKIEVVPERRPPALELAALRESVPAITKAKSLLPPVWLRHGSCSTSIREIFRRSEPSSRRR